MFVTTPTAVSTTQASAWQCMMRAADLTFSMQAFDLGGRAAHHLLELGAQAAWRSI